MRILHETLKLMNFRKINKNIVGNMLYDFVDNIMKKL